MNVRGLRSCAVALLLGASLLHAQDSRYRPLVTKTYELSRLGGQIPGPETPEDASNWRVELERWREQRLVKMGFDGALYERPELAWTQRAFVETKLLIWDRYLYDVDRRQYTVDRFLDDLAARYGGVDCVILWHGYPNLGVDHRNQFDLLRDVPGGIDALRDVVGAFHRRGVKVLFAHLPWDLGTREEGAAHWTVLTRLLAEVGADGLYGDTYDSLPPAWEREAERLSHPLALEPQNALLDSALAWNLMTWGEEWSTSFVPTVSHHKWLEPRHMVHLVRRHARDRTEELQHAFFNGSGYVAWENVWGNWNGITPRDAEALRRIGAIERAFAPLLVSREWEPYAPAIQRGVFASRFSQGNVALWTLVNRTEYEAKGTQLERRHEPGTKYYDLWRGAELAPELEGDIATLRFALEARGFGAVLSAPSDALPTALAGHLERTRSMGGVSLESFSNVWQPPAQKLVEIAATRRATAPPAGMILVPGSEFDFRVSGVAIEDDDRDGVDVQFPWENSPRLHHQRRLAIEPFYIDRHPVTNAEFKRFLEETAYHPGDPHNFLKHWNDGTYVPSSADQPVTWVSLEDARAYAAWAGKRLPHEWEWQYAAQGGDGRLYPWGNEWDEAAVPVPEKGRSAPYPDAVDSHPRGASPFGVMDLVGNVWQWTDEYRDEHTRAAVLRGGSSYQPQGSFWYFPPAYRLDRHAKYLLMSPSRDRSGTIGFRCVVDAR